MTIEKTLLDKVAAALLEKEESYFDIAELQNGAADEHGIAYRKTGNADRQSANADEQQ
jgi:hypothetical protein